jgi:photosystem II stability/assembly factor-like uncharacterized protein
MRRLLVLLLAAATLGGLATRHVFAKSAGGYFFPGLTTSNSFFSPDSTPPDPTLFDPSPANPSSADPSAPRVQFSHTTESLRGASAVSRTVAWASGTHGTYLRTTDAGVTWSAAQVPDAAALDFRAVVAFSADEAFLMSSGSGELSRIYHTSDGGVHWQLQFTNTNPKGFFDSMVFWDRTHGVMLGDPIANESGQLRFEVLVTDDGENWRPIPAAQMPPAVKGEGAFAASNSCITILPSASDGNVWFATGGTAARVFHSADRGKSWEVFETPILHGVDSAGIFSIAFRDAMHGVIAGGDYKRPDDDGPNLAFTEDGGKTWKLSDIRPQAYFSAVAYDRGVEAEAVRQEKEEAQAERAGKKIRVKPAPPQRLFLVGQDFVFVFRPPANPRRIGGDKKLGLSFNAVSAYPEGGALIVGKKGSIVLIP